MQTILLTLTFDTLRRELRSKHLAKVFEWLCSIVVSKELSSYKIVTVFLEALLNLSVLSQTLSPRSSVSIVFDLVRKND